MTARSAVACSASADELVGSVETLLPVDLRIPGCPPAPEAIAQAILALIDGDDTRFGSLLKRPARVG